MFEVIDLVVMKAKDDIFEKYGWKVRVKDTNTNKNFTVKCFIRKMDRALLCTTIPDNYYIDNSDDEIEEMVRDYLIDQQETYMGEDGDFYLVGEDQ